MKIARSQYTPAQLISHLQESRKRMLELIADLDDNQMLGPRLDIVNPLRWEIAHAAFFQEFWLLRHLRGFEPIRPAPHLDSDKLYDSARVAHDTRRDLPLPSKQDTIAYMRRILDRVVEETIRNEGRELRDGNGYDEAYFLELCLLHEDMHNEAITYTRQTLGLSRPSMRRDGSAQTIPAEPGVTNARLGDAQIPGGKFRLGSSDDSGFIFDNEQWAHDVEVRPFSISRAAVTQAEFAQFVNDAGYHRREWWGDEGWLWRESVDAEQPVYWRSAGKDKWERRVFDQWVPLEADLPVVHINWYESEAYCRWAKRRMPIEAEWEMAASCEPAMNGRRVAEYKRRYPWGDEPPAPERANLDWSALTLSGLAPANAFIDGASAFGVRQMMGNVWEWAATDFTPYPGFAAGPYKEYSEPWFGNHKILRGGCWATRSRLIRNSYRNFYKPDRRDVWAGLRTCAV